MAANVIFTNSHNTSQATIRTTPIAFNAPMHSPVSAARAARRPGPPKGRAKLVAGSLVCEQVAERLPPVTRPLMQPGQVEVRVGELGGDLESLGVHLQRLGFAARLL